MSHEALPSGFKGDSKNLSSSGFLSDSLVLKANVCPKPTHSRSKSTSTLDVSAVLAERPVETLVNAPCMPTLVLILHLQNYLHSCFLGSLSIGG